MIVSVEVLLVIFCCSNVQNRKTGESGSEFNGNRQSSAKKVKLYVTKNDAPKNQMELTIPIETWLFLGRYHKEKITMALNGVEVITNWSESGKVLLISENLSNLNRKNLEALPDELEIRSALACFSDQCSQEQIAILIGWLRWNSNILIMKREKSDDGEGTHCVVGNSHDVSETIEKLKKANRALDKERKPADFLSDSTVAGQKFSPLWLRILETKLTSIPLIIAEPHLLYFHKMISSNNSFAIMCHEGDLLKQDVDMIICSSSTKPQFTKGLARKIKDALMFDIEAEMQKAYIKPTDSNVVETCKLKCKHVMFVAMPYMKDCKTEQEGQQTLTTTIINCLSKADDFKASTIAMPAIGSGWQYNFINILILLVLIIIIVNYYCMTEIYRTAIYFTN